MNRRTLLVLVVLFVAMGIIALLQAQKGPPPAFDSQATLASYNWMGQTLNMSIEDIAAVPIIAQEPRMAPHVPRMIGNIAEDLGVAPAARNIKATTTELLGFIGRAEGIAAQAVALIE